MSNDVEAAASSLCAFSRRPQNKFCACNFAQLSEVDWRHCEHGPRPDSPPSDVEAALREALENATNAAYEAGELGVHYKHADATYTEYAEACAEVERTKAVFTAALAASRAHSAYHGNTPMSHELDAAVAVEVMGEPEPPKIPEDAERAVVSAYLAGDVSLSDGGNWWLSCVYDDGDIPTWKPLPFSGNVADAWMVVKKLVDPDNYEFVLASDSYGDRLVFKAGFHGLIDDVECHGHEAPTAPEAICLAALEAVRAEP